MARLRYVMICGFLGAGKTTLIGKLARAYADQGLKVGIVTNDQAHGLVDTMSLRAMIISLEKLKFHAATWAAGLIRIS